MSKGSRNKARQAALQALYQWQLTGQAPDHILREFIEERPLHGVEVEYFRELLQQIPSHAEQLDELLKPHLDREIAEIDPIERAILRLGAYELAYQPAIPYKVVLNEAVDLAKIFGGEQGHRFVNAVLDKLAATLRAPELAPVSR